jgi:hypothetical protein
MSNINRVAKLIINLDTTMASMCAYRQCSDRRARSIYQIRMCEHQPVKCSLVDNPPPGQYFGRHMWFAFCSESCMDFHLAELGNRAKDTAARNRGQIGGMHSPGMRGTIR